MLKGLSAAELLKPGREYRQKLIKRKIDEGLPFQLTDGKTAVFKKEPAVLFSFDLALKQRDMRALNAITFRDSKGMKTYRLKDIAKSAEFGGRGGGSGTRAEDMALSDLKEKLQKILITQAVPFINLKIGNKNERVSDIQSTPGTPKSDFHFLDPNGKEVFWISHKDGASAKDFQQYGGLVEIDNEVEVQNFAKDVKEYLNGFDSFPSKTAFMRKVNDVRVIQRSLFGKDYKSGTANSRQNIDVLYQGDMHFVKTGNFYTIKSNHTVHRGDVPTGEYEPWFMVRQSKDRTQFGIRAARFFVVPKIYGKSRNATII